MAGWSGVPVAADYDGDGAADPALFDHGLWIVRGSSSGVRVTRLGGANAIPVPADYDGDGRVDLAVFDAGEWTWIASASGRKMSTRFGSAADVPVRVAVFTR